MGSRTRTQQGPQQEAGPGKHETGPTTSTDRHALTTRCLTMPENIYGIVQRPPPGQRALFCLQTLGYMGLGLHQ